MLKIKKIALILSLVTFCVSLQGCIAIAAIAIGVSAKKMKNSSHDETYQQCYQLYKDKLSASNVRRIKTHRKPQKIMSYEAFIQQKPKAYLSTCQVKTSPHKN